MGGEGRLEIALGAGGYVRLGEVGWVLVTTPRAPVGPLSLVVAGLGGERAQAGWPARTQDGSLLLGPHRIGLTPLPAAAVPAPPSPPANGLAASARGDLWPALAAPESSPNADHGSLLRALAAALEASLAPPPALLGGLEALGRGQLQPAVALLAGRGDGLTPAGDDVLAGYAGWRHAAGSPVTLAPIADGRASPIGLGYLRCAERGELPHPAAALRAALIAGDAPAAARRARALRTWGTSSGHALLWGMAAAVRRRNR
jgi:hypothetical protein